LALETISKMETDPSICLDCLRTVGYIRYPVNYSAIWTMDNGH